jgi:hypothetical protein
VSPADDERELEDIADRLYELRPDAFAAARDNEVSKARAAGRQPLVRELGRLRKPTQSAWLINLLWRDQREVLEQLFEMAAGLSQAQAQASGAELRTLTAQRRELERALMLRARALAQQAGVAVSAAMEREAQETLSAALVRPDVADDVRTGRLVKPVAYAGFGSLPSAPPSLASAAASGRVATQAQPPTDLAGRAAQRARDREEAARNAQEARARQQREEAERRTAQARVMLQVAVETLADRRRAADAARAHHQELLEQLDQARERLRQLEQEVAAAEQAATAAARRQDQAQQAHASAAQALDNAERSAESISAR